MAQTLITWTRTEIRPALVQRPILLLLSPQSQPEDRPSKLRLWTVEYLFCLWFKGDHTTWTGNATSALNLGKADLVSEHTCNSPRSDFDISLSSKFRRKCSSFNTVGLSRAVSSIALLYYVEIGRTNLARTSSDLKQEPDAAEIICS